MNFIEKYGEICRGIDCTKIKSCNECKIGEKLNLCAEYEDFDGEPIIVIGRSL